MRIVVADTGTLISWGIVGKIEIINKVFDEFFIPYAVFEELEKYKNPEFPKKYMKLLQNHISEIKSKNHLALLMDYGESESVILYQELNADFLLIDDQKAGIMAESLGVNCVGSIGLLLLAKQKGIVKNLYSIFRKWGAK
jgi:uncharacterized protein